jgi:chromate transporter
MHSVPDGGLQPAQAAPLEHGLKRPALSAWMLLRVWFGLGLQSFGGGTATLYLIRRAVVERYGWLSEDEFTRSWAVCQIAPGINLVGLTILIGWRLAGVRGIVATLTGLLLPSVTITVLMTALYAGLQNLAVVRAALRGVVPATAGLGLLLALQMARPLLRQSRSEGRVSLSFSVTLLAGSAAFVALTQLSVITIVWGAGAAGALFHWRRHVASRTEGQPSA